MRLRFLGHDYKYAVEQVMINLFPDERPVYGEPIGAETLSAEVRLTHGAQYSTAVTILYHEGKRFRGTAQILTPDSAGMREYNRLMQKIIRFSFFRAATTATGSVPPWGVLSGVRPAKRATLLLKAGKSPKQVRRILEREYQVSPTRAALGMDTARIGLATKASLEPKDICLYIGIPFCPTRCTYCSFVSQDVHRSGHLIMPFLDALAQEIDATARVVCDLGLRVAAVYIGGGTPTTLSAAQLAQLTGMLSDAFDLSHLREYTVEAGRPDTVDLEKLAILRAAGVTRISVNPQSMEDTVLEAIGRGHTAAQVIDAVAMVHTVDFPVLNMDLIVGLPGDTLDGFQRTLTQAIQFGAKNITVHTLARKRGTQVALDQITVPDAKAVAEMLNFAHQALRDAGYAPYYLYCQKYTAGGFENIGWCKLGTESFYNIVIMEELCSILSLGGGASTKLVSPNSEHIARIFNAKYPYEYIEGIDKILASKDEIAAFYAQEGF